MLLSVVSLTTASLKEMNEDFCKIFFFLAGEECQMTVKVSALAHIPKMFKSRVSLPMTPTAQMKDGRIPLLPDMSLCGRSPEASE